MEYLTPQYSRLEVKNMNRKTYFVGYQKKYRVKITNDVDCLSPDITRFERYNLVSTTIQELIRWYEVRGYNVCVDTEDCSYETV